MSEFLICLAGVAALGLMAMFVVPVNWDTNVDDQGEAVAEKFVEWWRSYRSYRKVVSSQYSRHDGTQGVRNPRRYYSQPNTARPAYPAVAVNYWFEQAVPAYEPSAQRGRHLAIVA